MRSKSSCSPLRNGCDKKPEITPSSRINATDTQKTKIVFVHCPQYSINGTKWTLALIKYRFDLVALKRKVPDPVSDTEFDGNPTIKLVISCLWGPSTVMYVKRSLCDPNRSEQVLAWAYVQQPCQLSLCDPNRSEQVLSWQYVQQPCQNLNRFLKSKD